MNKLKTFTPEEVKAICSGYEQLKTIKVLAAEFSSARKVIRRILLENGIKIRPKALDVTGQRYGRLTAIRSIGNNRSGSKVWEWKCDCGNTKAISLSHVRTGHITSCGCYRLEQHNKAHANDITGQRFGKLTAVKPVGNVCRAGEKKGQIIWQFKCDCGNTTETVPTRVKAGATSSCGCFQRQVTSELHRKDITGQRFGLLTAVEPVKSLNGTWLWRFECDCGGERVARLKCAIRGLTKSCGCLARGADSLDALLDNNFRAPEDPAMFYIFTLARFAGYLKPGITVDLQDRADDEYGEQLLAIEGPRLDMWLLEQAVLRETRLLNQCPRQLTIRGWVGQTEVRRMAPDALIRIASELHELLLDLGRWEFALRFVPMTDEQRKAIQQLQAEQLCAA